MPWLDDKGQVVFSTEEVVGFSAQQLRGMSASLRRANVISETVLEQDLVLSDSRTTTLDGLEEVDLEEFRAILGNSIEELV